MVVVPTVLYGKFVAYGCKPQEKHMNLPILYSPRKWWEIFNVVGYRDQNGIFLCDSIFCKLYSEPIWHYVKGVTA